MLCRLKNLPEVLVLANDSAGLDCLGVWRQAGRLEEGGNLKAPGDAIKFLKGAEKRLKAVGQRAKGCSAGGSG
jgi:hypothetical protein